MQDTADAGIFARESESLGRVVQVGVAGGRLVAVEFPGSVPPDAGDDHPLLDRVLAAAGGDADAATDLPVALTVSADHRRVLEAVETVPRGETVTVDRLASLAGFDADDPDDRATVEAALRENPVPVAIPDHRVEGPGATPPEVAAALRRAES
jgi:methylated-DNA-[protein]-cysteine S-methyltransferase